jgi:hypothetical protein
LGNTLTILPLGDRDKEHGYGPVAFNVRPKDGAEEGEQIGALIVGKNFASFDFGYFALFQRQQQITKPFLGAEFLLSKKIMAEETENLSGALKQMLNRDSPFEIRAIEGC